MSDDRLRILERDALASGDSSSWTRYYVEKRRLGWSQPSGSRSVTLEAPHGCIVAHVQIHCSLEERSVAGDVELEWKRCGLANGQIVVRSIGVDSPLMFAPWREALIYLTRLDGAYPSGCIPEARGLNVSKLKLSKLLVTFPEFLPDPMIMVRFTEDARERMLRAMTGGSVPAGVAENIPRVRPAP